ncbi:FecR family protein [Mucilaginibacter sp. OK098]|uniref:FecR family protein n=1 Tax=Mucilaginibacter sp. OK098 TaxID=1855297 RepID=UPI000910A9DD|nr:FecR family protein [Mucilaginibacter sp. OK098]SHM11535.1 FecR family protein [Mucilaginibacter sp. OK098]
MENRYQELAKKWLNKTITPDEQAEFAAWYNADQDIPVDIPPTFAENEEVLRERILNKINRDIKKDNNRFKIIIPTWLRVAAGILLFAGCFIYYFVQIHQPVKQLALIRQKPQLKNDVSPGGNKAILTLANGSKIDLNDVKNGVLASQGKTVLKKDKDGQLIYEAPGGKAKDSSSIYNTITIPKGGQFQIVLSDGSKVWLNSASSITFPTAFSKIERKVTITGEVYFEVAKNKHLPFRVVAGKQTVEVLGTHFNINAYSDEDAIKTTLIEGSVKVSADSQSAILKPEQQSSILNNKHGHISINTVDTDDVLAWKNGNFLFERAEIQLIMREASRWYDVDIKYESELPPRRFTGSISRNVNLSELLKMLKYTGINFKIEGKTIIVTP